MTINETINEHRLRGENGKLTNGSVIYITEDLINR